VGDCVHGFYGTRCDNKCSEGCAAGSRDWLTGSCHGGCRCGYTGDRCEEDTCSHHCKSSCIYDETRDCLTCTAGCRGGWTSARCDEKCGERCMVCDQRGCLQCHSGLYGPDCNITVPHCSSNCVNDICEMDGECTDGCKQGFSGPKCNFTLINDASRNSFPNYTVRVYKLAVDEMSSTGKHISMASFIDIFDKSI